MEIKHEKSKAFKYQFSSVQFSSVQSLSRVRLFATPWIAARQASLSITNPESSLKLMSIESVMPSIYLILCRLLLLPPIPPSIRGFSNELKLLSIEPDKQWKLYKLQLLFYYYCSQMEMPFEDINTQMKLCQLGIFSLNRLRFSQSYQRDCRRFLQPFSRKKKWKVHAETCLSERFSS